MQAIVQTSVFSPNFSGSAREFHSFVKYPKAGTSFGEQMKAIVDAISELSATATVRFVRFFLSDAANQELQLRQAMSNCAFPVSFIQQPPLDGTKLSAWVYAAEEAPGISDLVWDSFMTSEAEGSYAQMMDIFEGYEKKLVNQGLTIAGNCVRTWIYIRDVDVNYRGMVKGRCDYFDRIGLTADTHYIASTGIEGRNATPSKFVTMDALSLNNITPEQIQYLYAKDHLSPTADYGVTFERGTAVHFADRTHAYISGTASIDSKGAVLYEGNIEKQTERMLENIAALLSEISAGLNDIAMAIVYLRDTADYIPVKSMIERICPNLNAEFVLAPVCRPTWLVEMECIAIV